MQLWKVLLLQKCLRKLVQQQKIPFLRIQKKKRKNNIREMHLHLFFF